MWLFSVTHLCRDSMPRLKLLRLSCCYMRANTHTTAWLQCTQHNVVLLEFSLSALQGVFVCYSAAAQHWTSRWKRNRHTAYRIKKILEITGRRGRRVMHHRTRDPGGCGGTCTHFQIVKGIVSKDCSGFTSIQKYFNAAGTDRTGGLRPTDEKSCCHSFAELFACRMNGDTWGHRLVCAGVLISVLRSTIPLDEMLRISEGKLKTIIAVITAAPSCWQKHIKSYRWWKCASIPAHRITRHMQICVQTPKISLLTLQGNTKEAAQLGITLFLIFST